MKDSTKPKRKTEVGYTLGENELKRALKKILGAPPAKVFTKKKITKRKKDAK